MYFYNFEVCVCNFISVLIRRWTLESLGLLEPRKSALEEDFEEEEEKEENDQLNGMDDEGHDKEYYRGRSPERERDRDRRRDRDRYRYLACLWFLICFS